MLRLVWKGAKLLASAAGRLARAAADALDGSEHGARFAPNRLARAMIMVSLIALGVWWLMAQFIWVRSPSIDVWAVRPSPGLIRRSDLVMFTLIHPLAGPEPVNVTKYALCLPGDHLASYTMRSERYPGRREAVFFCNGALLGVSKVFGRQGQRLDYFRWSGGTVPKGRAYIGSSYKDGFDSRYFGLVPVSKLQRMERVL